MKIGEYTFLEGDRITISKYTFEIRRGNLMLEVRSAKGNVAYVGFDKGIFILLLDNIQHGWTIKHKA